LIKFYYLIEKTLEAHGYKRYEISNYALPKFKCRHNLIYWKIKPYLGLGPSAVSRVENLRWENPKNLNHYLNALLKENRLPLKIVESLDNYELAKEYIFMGLRLKEGISLNLLKEKFNYTISEVKADILIKKNLIEKRKGRIRLTFEGKLLHNQIVSFLWKSLCN